MEEEPKTPKVNLLNLPVEIIFMIANFILGYRWLNEDLFSLVDYNSLAPLRKDKATKIIKMLRNFICFSSSCKTIRNLFADKWILFNFAKDESYYYYFVKMRAVRTPWNKIILEGCSFNINSAFNIRGVDSYLIYDSEIVVNETLGAKYASGFLYSRSCLVKGRGRRRGYREMERTDELIKPFDVKNEECPIHNIIRSEPDVWRFYETNFIEEFVIFTNLRSAYGPSKINKKTIIFTSLKRKRNQ